MRCIQTGLLYRNAIPHIHSVHAYFPSVVSLPNGEMLATIVLGEAFEAPNLHTHVCRSVDQGKTWTLEGELYPGTTERITSDTSRLTVMPDGELVAFMIRADRSEHPGEGLTNHETLGFVPVELLLARSRDLGHTWTRPRVFDPPLVGPAFEMCCPITPLADGRWILPTQTWPGWEGDCPNDVRMIALVSHDRGETWPEYMDVMAEPGQQTFFWESKIVELPDGRLLAVAWVYDNVAKQDRPNHYALSEDGGKSWSAPASTGLYGQTLTPFVIDKTRILCVYRRMDQPGLWAVMCRLEGRTWRNGEPLPLWGANTAGLTATGTDMAANFNVLRFGAPCITKLPNGNCFVAFWCYEDCVGVIRWIELDLR